MKLLLPNRFKKTGAVIAPLGFAIWLLMQSGYISEMLTHIVGEPNSSTVILFRVVNAIIGTISFLSFLGGIYFVSFSREKIEDEMVQRTRLDSFQFAALVQIIFTIAGFLFMIIVGEPKDAGLMLFFILSILLFWLSFIGRFNYILHFKLR